MSKAASQDPLPQTVHGYVVHVSKSLEKTSTAPDGFFRFKLQMSQEQIKISCVLQFQTVARDRSCCN